MKRSVEVESRRIGGTGLVVGRGEGRGEGEGQGQGVSQGEGLGEGVGQGEGRGEGLGVVVGLGAGAPCHTQQASPSTTAPQFATALRGSGRSPVSLASKGGVA